MSTKIFLGTFLAYLLTALLMNFFGSALLMVINIILFSYIFMSFLRLLYAWWFYLNHKTSQESKSYLADSGMNIIAAYGGATIAGILISLFGGYPNF